MPDATPPRAVIVDTHAHLYDRRFEADRDAVVARAQEAGVTRILVPAVDPATITEALDLCDCYPGVFAMAAVHPCSVAEAGPDALRAVELALADDRVVAVGETGLDYYWSLDDVPAQQASLRAHVRLALDADLPLSLHTRDRDGRTACVEDTLRLLREERDTHVHGDRLRGVFHCFGGPASVTADVLALGFCIGLGGTLTFKNGGVAEAVADVPLSRIVLETDAPYLPPVPHRGTRNEPAYTRLVAERLAEARGATLEDVAAATTATAERLFGLPVIALGS